MKHKNQNQNQNRKGTLLEIKAGALLLQHNMSSPLLGEAIWAQMEYDRLVDQFYAEDEKLLSAEDYEIAKRDFDVFLRLLDAAIERESRQSDASIKP